MMIEPAVRSLRVAAALCDRFAELLEGPDTVTSRKQRDALFGVGGNDEALSLRIGEVQQMYPEIWRHLDDARAGFAARGVDVAAYDQIRAAEGSALGAAVDFQHRRHGAGQYAVDEIVKSANFNRVGLQRARTAIDALMRATPDVDWAAIIRAEAEDPDVAAFTRAARTKRWIQIGLLALVVCAPLLYVGNTCRQKQARIDARREEVRKQQQLSEPERAALAERVDGLRAVLAKARSGWATAVTPDALAAVVPGDMFCPHRFAAPSPRAAESYVRSGSVDGNYFGAGTFTTYRAGEPLRDTRLAAAAAALDDVAARLADGTADRHDRRALDRVDAPVVFFVVDREVAPVIDRDTGETRYTAGEVTGHAYVFDVASARILCAGAIEVRNAGDFDYRYVDTGAEALLAARAVLARDLEVRIRMAIASELRGVPVASSR